jgi:hypothetical protein
MRTVGQRGIESKVVMSMMCMTNMYTPKYITYCLYCLRSTVDNYRQRINKLRSLKYIDSR